MNKYIQIGVAVACIVCSGLVAEGSSSSNTTIYNTYEGTDLAEQSTTVVVPVWSGPGWYSGRWYGDEKAFNKGHPPPPHNNAGYNDRAGHLQGKDSVRRGKGKGSSEDRHGRRKGERN